MTNQGKAETIAAAALPMPRATNNIGRAQQVVPIRASPKPPNKEALVVSLSRLSILISSHSIPEQFTSFTAVTTARFLVKLMLFKDMIPLKHEADAEGELIAI